MPRRALSVFAASASPPAADDAEAGVERLRRERLAAGNGDNNGEIGRGGVAALGGLGERRRDHRPRARVDGGLADRERQARPRHPSDSRPGMEGDAAAGGPARHLGDDQRAMRHIGIVAGVLDDAGARRALRQLLERQREARLLAARQADGDGIGEGAGEERLARCARRRRRAGPGGPAAPQGSARSP